MFLLHYPDEGDPFMAWNEDTISNYDEYLDDAMDDDVIDGQPYLPSPMQIAIECQNIRLGWSEKEHRKRARIDLNPFTLATRPVKVHIPNFLDIFNG